MTSTQYPVSDAFSGTFAQLLAENEKLRLRLEDAEQTFAAIQAGEVDAIVVIKDGRERISTFETADRPYRYMVEQMQQGAAMLAPDGTVLYANPKLAEMAGTATGKIIGAALVDLIDAGARNLCDKLLAPGDGFGRQAELDIRQAEKRLLPVFVSVAEMKDSDNLIAIFTDLTEQATRKKLEEELAERQRTEQSLRNQAELLNLAHEAIIVRGPAGEITFWSRGAEETYGWTADEARGQAIHHLLKTRSPRPLEEITADMMSVGQWDGELTHICKEGVTITVASRWAMQRDNMGHAIGVLEMNRDITERKAAEEMLRRSETLLRTVLDGSADAVLATNDDGVIQSINATGEIMFGYAPEEIVGRHISVLVPEGYSDLHARHRSEADAEKVIGVARESEGRRKDGTVFPVGLTLNETRYVERPLFVGFVRDRSSQREIEARLNKLQAERLSAMGGLAAGLAHELNQPLAAASTFIETAQALLEMPPDSRPSTIENNLKWAVEEIMRAGEIMKRLRGMVTHGEPDKTFLGLHELIKDATTLSALRRLGNNIPITFRLNASDDSVLADRIQIKQLLANLLRNAYEAMRTSPRRKLCISTSSIAPDMIPHRHC